MGTSIELDSTLKSALKLLHSPCPDSAEKIRNILDDIIKTRFGSTKMLANTLSKKILNEEKSSPGMRAVRTKSIEKKVIPSIVEPEEEEPPAVILPSTTIVLEDDEEMETGETEAAAVDDQFKEFEDLLCIVCRRMDYTERNRLVECVDCHTLYHQECHTPIVSEANANDATWLCVMCKSTKSSIPVKASSSPSLKHPSSSTSGSGSSSSTSVPVSAGKNYESSSGSSSSSESKKSKKSSRSSPSMSSSHSKSKSSSSSSTKNSSSHDTAEKSRDSGSGGGSSSSKSTAPAPNINIISADKRIQIMKKKAAKLHDSKRKHK